MQACPLPMRPPCEPDMPAQVAPPGDHHHDAHALRCIAAPGAESRHCAVRYIVTAKPESLFKLACGSAFPNGPAPGY